MKLTIERRLNLVICGTAIGNRSAQRKEYYAGRGNRFWQTLCNVRLTKKKYCPNEYWQLIEEKIGLTDLVRKKSGNDNGLKPSDFEVQRFRNDIEKYQPKVICFNGKKAAKVALDVKEVDYGFYSTDKYGKTKVFVAPSTSGSASRFWDETFWKELADYIQSNFKFK
jgi:TDG/mug DNA glycosylase family protein